MVSFWYFLFGYAVIEIEALRIEQVLTRIAGHGIELVGVKRVSHLVIRAKVKKKDMGRVQAAVSGAATVRTIRLGGRSSIFAFIKRHIALTVGIVLMAAFIIFLSQCCLHIEIVGTDQISEYELYQFVLSQGARPYQLRSRIDTEQLETQIWKEYPTLTYVYIAFEGINLKVEVREKIAAPDVEDNEVCSIYATQDGIITELTVTSGRAVVEVGDRVKEGDLLITGHYQLGESVFQVPAKGTVKAKIDYVTAVSTKEPITEQILTGNTAEVRVMQFGKREVTISGENPFDVYTRSVEETAQMGEGYSIPVRFLTYTYYEAEEVYSEEKKQAFILQATEAAYFKAYGVLPEDAEICGFLTHVTEEEVGLTVTLTLTTYEEISYRGGLSQEPYQISE